MNDITVLSPEDLAILKGLVYREKTRPKNTTGRGAVPGYADPEPTTEVYIAKVHSNGIPALTETASNADDIPGVRTCSIYRIDVESGTPRLRPMGFSRLVYNLSLSEIVEEDTPWIAIKREKSGSWLADTGTVSVAPGTGSDSEPICGYLILDCPLDHPGTGSEVTVDPPTGSPPTSVGYASLCNDGDIVLSTIHLTIAHGSNALSVPLTSTDGHTWTWSGTATDLGSCTSFQLVGADLTCEPPWELELAAYLDGVLQAFRYPINPATSSWTMVSSDPIYWTYNDGPATLTGCGTEDFELAITE